MALDIAYIVLLVHVNTRPKTELHRNVAMSSSSRLKQKLGYVAGCNICIITMFCFRFTLNPA